MDMVKKLVGAYLIGVALVVAIYFVINAFLVDSIDVALVWTVLDVLMVIALAPALLYNYARKREECGQDPDGAVTRRYLEANVAFYATAAITILFLYNWFWQMSLGLNSPEPDNHTAWTIWAMIDTALPLVLGATGCRMLFQGNRVP